MLELPKQERWYNQSILPNWLPGWVCAAMLGGAGALGVYVWMARQATIGGCALAFAVGVVVMLGLLSFTYLRVQPTERSSSYLPPLAVRFPIFVAAAVGISAIWVADGKITTGAARGGRAIIEGLAVDVLGMLIMLGAGVASTFFLHWRPRALANLLAGGIGLLVAVAGLTFAVVRVTQRWF